FSCTCNVDGTCLVQVKADKASDQGSEWSTSPDSTCTNSTISGDLKQASNYFPAKFIEKSAPRAKERTRNVKEFKLNPTANMVYMPNSCEAANMVYVPNSSPPVPLATIHLKVFTEW
ncbi:putative GPI-anchored protein PB15E9.01c-like, partial [Trifolium medium]|nr:putative GPI-anchored protein PB15E9.01c-like [Trifolium medium]